jgi:hypothetical protein
MVFAVEIILQREPLKSEWTVPYRSSPAQLDEKFSTGRLH